MMTKSPFLCLCIAYLLFWGSTPANAVCTQDRDCDDGLYCNGMELCRHNEPHADAYGCITGMPPCATALVCNENEARCDSPSCIDRDRDGHGDITCGGDDCDDNDPNRFPGNPEDCDPEGHDEDCDDGTPGTRDADGDGYFDIGCFNYEDQFFRGVQR